VTMMHTESSFLINSVSRLELTGFKSAFFADSEILAIGDTELILATVTWNSEGISNEISSLP